MENPWTQISTGKMILDMDQKIIETHNHQYEHDENRKISTIDYPEPFIGNPDAKVYLLLGNPGRSIEKEEECVRQIQVHDVEEIIFRNLRHQAQENCLPFYLLDEKFNFHDGHGWWKKVFTNLPHEKGDFQKIASSLFAVELYGYHSVAREKNLLSDKGKLPSIGYSVSLIQKAIRNKKLIIIARAVNHWFGLVPELKSYHRCHLLASNRGIQLSKTSISPVAFGEVERILAS